MKLTYYKTRVDQVHLHTAHVRAIFCGREIEVTLTVYNFGTGRSLVFDMQPAKQPTRGLRDGIMFISQRDRSLEQGIYLPYMAGTILERSDLYGLGVTGGRTIAAAIMRKFESVFETARQWVLRHIATATREIVIDYIEALYWRETERTVRDILKGLNWRWLLAGCDDELLGVVEYTLTNNSLRYYDLRASETDIPLLSDDSISVNQVNLADMKAEALLEQVIGKEAFRRYKICGYIRVESQGYKFILAPKRFITCWDPQGRMARLCIHTVGLSCNPLDEVVIAYLHLKHPAMFTKFMQTAVYHNMHKDFCKPWERKLVCA